MFSLIITIIAIALVAALALATIYYGGSAYGNSNSKAHATRIVNQGQQILAADRLYRVQNQGEAPPNMQVLIDKGYLKAVPVAMGSFEHAPGMMATATAADQPWQMVTINSSTAYVLPSGQVDESTCEAVNLQAYGQAGILKSVYGSLRTQCYGSDVAALTVVVQADATALTAPTMPNTPPVKGTSVSVPTDPSDGDWLKTPTSVAGSGTGPSTGGNQSNPGGGVTSTDGNLGDATGGMHLSVNKTSINFGNVNAGSTSASITVTVTNNGTAFAKPDIYTLSNNFVSDDNCYDNGLAPGASCTVTVSASPQLPGNLTDSLHVQDDTIQGYPYVNLPLSVTSVAPDTTRYNTINLSVHTAGYDSDSPQYVAAETGPGFLITTYKNDLGRAVEHIETDQDWMGIGADHTINDGSDGPTSCFNVSSTNPLPAGGTCTTTTAINSLVRSMQPLDYWFAGEYDNQNHYQNVHLAGATIAAH